MSQNKSQKIEIENPSFEKEKRSLFTFCLGDFEIGIFKKEIFHFFNLTPLLGIFSFLLFFLKTIFSVFSFKWGILLLIIIFQRIVPFL